MGVWRQNDGIQGPLAGMAHFLPTHQGPENGVDEGGASLRPFSGPLSYRTS